MVAVVGVVVAAGVVVVAAAEVVVKVGYAVVVVVVVLVVEVVAAVGPDADGSTANHTPLIPCPRVSPAAWSLM